MPPTRFVAFALVISLGACSPDGSSAAAAPDAEGRVEGESTSPFIPLVSVRELMETVVEPAAETYWDAVGWIIDADSTHAIRPRSEEEWIAVRNAAVQVAESGNLLMMEGRAVDNGSWIALSQAMTRVAERAIAASVAKDEAAVFTVGGELYEACTACHSAYALETLRPNAE
jgi:hypothetical protein